MFKTIVSLVAVLLLSACGGAINVETLVDTTDVTAMTISPSTGELVYGVRATGVVYESSVGTNATQSKIAEVAVSTGGQRGLLGLAADATGRVFAGYTASGGDENVTVAQVSPGPLRVVWSGPASAELANGGHIAFSPDGRLTIGIGDLTVREKLDDPNAPNGKFYSLDPDGGADQTPITISTHWNNPFAFTYTPNGDLWVADNEPGNDSERLALANDGATATHITRIGAHQVGSGLSAAADGSLYLCTYLGRTLQHYGFDKSGNAQKDGKPLAKDCSLGVVTAKDGSLIYASDKQLKRVLMD